MNLRDTLMNMIRFNRELLAVIILGGSSFVANGQCTDQTSVERKDERVCIVGVQHAPGLFWSELLSPGHVRMVLKAFDPTAVGIETNPEWHAKGVHYRQTFEAFGVVEPWAVGRCRPVFPVDWIGDASTRQGDGGRIARIRRERQVLEDDSAQASAYGYGRSRSGWIDELHVDELPDLRFLNGPENAKIWLKWLDSGRDEPGSAQQYIARRDQEIVSNIVDASREDPGDRLLVVIGAAHKANLERQLRERGFVLVSPLDLLGETDTQCVLDALTPLDAAAIITSWLDGSRRWAMTKNRFMTLRQILERGDAGAIRVLGKYVAMRTDQLTGRVEEARRIARELVSDAAAGRTHFPFRGHSWRLYLTVADAARLELSRSADLSGDREEARRWYDDLLRRIHVPPYDEAYGSDYLYMARAKNAISALRREGYSHSLDYPSLQVEELVPVNESKSAEAVAELMSLSREARWGEVVRKSESLLASDPLPTSLHAEVLYHLANARLRQNRLDEARAVARRIDDLLPRVPDASWLHREYARLHEALTGVGNAKRLRDALESFRQKRWQGVLDTLESVERDKLSVGERAEVVYLRCRAFSELEQQEQAEMMQRELDQLVPQLSDDHWVRRELGR